MSGNNLRLVAGVVGVVAVYGAVISVLLYPVLSAGHFLS